jgi:hypothetical protein
MQVKQKKDQYRPKVRASRNYCLQPASHAILESGRLKRPEPERGIETIPRVRGGRAECGLKRPEPERGIETHPTHSAPLPGVASEAA